MAIATRSDACLVRVRRGEDPDTLRQLGALLADPALAGLAAKIRGRWDDLAELEQSLVALTSPGAVDHGDVDLELAIEMLSAREEGLPRALAGLFVLAALESLARRYGPPTDYPGMAVTSIELVGLPVARWLQAAGASTAAATLAALLRQYMISDAAQRALPAGKAAIAACREIEAVHARHMAACCRQAAWSLGTRMKDEKLTRVCVAALYFALGDPLRARWIAAGRHDPSPGALVDLVAVSAELAPLDPLLQGVWLLTLGEARPDVPDDLRFHLRAVVPEFNGAFKGADAAAKNVLGASFSQAYAEAVFSYLGGLWDDDVTGTSWWKVLVEAFKLPPAMNEYRSGFVRLLELYSLIRPREPLPSSGVVAGMAGLDPLDRSDVREVATISLRMDGWTSQRGQLGRSVAYDSGFQIEPHVRKEPVERSLELLEEHRHAGLEYWLAVVPPLTEEPSRRRRRQVAADDRDLAREYRALGHLGTLEEAPLYARVYGQRPVSRVIQVTEGDRVQRLIECDERRVKWAERARKDWPQYAAERASTAARPADVGRLLGIGEPRDR